MKHTRKMKGIFGRMAKIERMERGRLCQMSGRPHFNHQTWQNDRNVVRYVPVDEAALVQEAIDGYALFKDLVEQYADEVIEQTRRERARAFPKPKKKPKRQPGNVNGSGNQK